MSYIRFRYHYYGVGQGLFTSGALLDPYKQKPMYLWVYDCGTNSKGAFGSKAENLDHSLDELGRVGRKTDTIDLLTLSHFDEDHVNGVVQLLDRFRVKMLLLPYMNLAERLLIAFSSDPGENTEEFLDFLIDPASYLAQRASKGIDRIVFVPPSSGNPPLEPDNEYPPGGPEIDEMKFRLEPQYSHEIKPPEDDTLVRHADQPIATGAGQTQVEYLHPDSGITITPFWEFVPYNEERTHSIPRRFSDQVIRLKNELLSNQPDTIRKLRGLYDSTFGGDGPSRNDISLFLYCGPIYNIWKNPRIYGIYGTKKYMSRLWMRSNRRHYASGARIVSQLYTGDGFLNTPERIDELKKHLGDERWKAISVLQVMHHGSRKNWCHEVGTQFPYCCMKVTCSEPSHHGHPHKEVEDNLTPMFQVNENAFTVKGRLYR
ncbi:MAG: hypothetical protein GVY36_04095 [Verrucomicrobia bacterium]|jgi:hypothetical protein|nr:hypothetical protein [Verrucomicrobiota bacterium]